MKNVISFSLWGNKSIYWKGAVENIKLAKLIYPGWICRFYIDKNCDENLINTLVGENVEVVLVEPNLIGETYNGSYQHSHQGMFWRFLPTENDDVDIFISRDCDSRLSLREFEAVQEWIKSGKKFHIMRDHPHHLAPIMGGMFGAKAEYLRQINLIDKIKYWTSLRMNYQLGVDQDFLAKIIYPIVYRDSLEHSEFGLKFGGEIRPFPTIRKDYEFVGDVFDENDIRHPDYWQIIKRYYEQAIYR
jgi:hypothetical protein